MAAANGVHVSNGVDGASSQGTFAFKGTDYEKVTRAARTVNGLRSGLMRDLFADDHGTTLPELKVVVAGDQSSGKSTLMERLTEIPMIRGGGICTKCPTEIRLFSTPPSGQAAPFEKSAAGSGPIYLVKTHVWKKQTRCFEDEVLFAEFVPKSNVAQKIREAQEKVLSDGGSPGAPLKVSQGLVIVEVYNAPVDLTLVDLPGIIANDEDPQVVRDIEALTTERLHAPGCIVVVVMSAAADIANSSTLGLLRRTPIDLAPAGPTDGDVSQEHQLRFAVVTGLDKVRSPQNWQQVLCGNDNLHNHIPKNMWYAVKNPDMTTDIEATARELDLKAAIDSEQQFFRLEHPATANDPNNLLNDLLKTLRDTQATDRCGIENLRKALSLSLNKLIMKEGTLRELQKQASQMKERLFKAEQALTQELFNTQSPAEYVAKLLDRVEKQMISRISGLGIVQNVNDATFHTLAEEIYKEFRSNINEHRPQFITPDLGHQVFNGKITPAMLAQFPTAGNVVAALKMAKNGYPIGEGERENVVLYCSSAWVETLWPQHVTSCREELRNVLEEEALRVVKLFMSGSYPKLENALRDAIKKWLLACDTAAKDQLDLMQEAEICMTLDRGLPFTILNDDWIKYSNDAKIPAVDWREVKIPGVEKPEDWKARVEYVQRCLLANFEVISRRFTDSALLIMRYHLVRNFAMEFQKGVLARLQITAGQDAALRDLKASLQDDPELKAELDSLMSQPTTKKLRHLEETLTDKQASSKKQALKQVQMAVFVADHDGRRNKLQWVQQALTALKDVSQLLAPIITMAITIATT